MNNHLIRLNSKVTLIVSRNQRAIVREGLDNRDSGLTGACTFQDKRIRQ